LSGILVVVRIQYTSIENPLLKDIPVHIYQTYPNKLDGEYQDYGLADIYYTRITTLEGASFDFIRIYISAELTSDIPLHIWNNESYIEYEGKKYRTEQDLLKMLMIIDNLRALRAINRLD
jgi:hypothetical protein